MSSQVSARHVVRSIMDDTWHAYVRTVCQHEKCNNRHKAMFTSILKPMAHVLTLITLITERKCHLLPSDTQGDHVGASLTCDTTQRTCDAHP